MLRGTVHWRGIERFAGEALTASEEHDLPVDSGELMLLLAGRLEAAGLYQRKIPRDLLPDRALDGARLAYGPAEDCALPVPPQDAAGRVAQLRAATETGLPADGTAADALREGLQMLGSAGLDVHGDPAVLLPALYAGLVAGDHEDLSEAGERAVAWALGLSEDSPLVPVTDVLLVAPERELDVDTVLGHLFGIPAFSEEVAAEDRQWHSSPGTALIGLAFELGHQQVINREGKVIRLGQDGAAMIEAQRRFFEEKFGRPGLTIRCSSIQTPTSRSQCRCPAWGPRRSACWKGLGYHRRGSTPTSTRTDFSRARTAASPASATAPNGTTRSTNT